MLVTLRIKNLALVDDLAMELREGFNAITGETGAGKSILIGALNLALGERADRSLIRTGADACTVEALFYVGRLKAMGVLLRELGLEPCTDGQLILKRTFSASGNNRQFINGSPATLQALKQIGELLVDIHGPHDHQSLLRTENQLRILDRFADLEESRADFAGKLQEMKRIEQAKEALVMDEKEFKRKLDLVEHQVNEIEAARISPEEEKTVEADYQMASNSQKLVDLVGRIQDAISEGEHPAVSSLSHAQRALKDLAAIDPRAAALEETNRNLVAQLQELSRDISQYASRVEVDPDRLQFLSERMTLIQGLKRKYGQTLAEVIAFGKSARDELRKLQGREEELSRLDAEAQKVAHDLEKIGKALRAARQKVIPRLVKVVTGHLQELGFLQCTFSAELTPCEPSASGMDAIEFRVAPNPGEPAKPLRDIASSGEMARVMLALKTALAEQDEVPVLVFDEVDANIGGEVGHRVGEKMARIGKQHQVLCITHLSQVAVCGNSHFVVSKLLEKGRTFTRIEELDAERRVEEIARMLGGKSDTALQHAREMLGEGKKTRKA
jgi:DNA repair protein RecN (Recombination protein N)